MEAIALLQCFNSSHIQRPLRHKKLRHYITNFSLVNVAEIPDHSVQSAFSHPSSSSNLSSVHELRELNSLNSLKETHAQVIKMFNEYVSDEKIQSLISKYLEFGDFQSAAKLLLSGSERNYLHFNLFIKEFKSFGGGPFEILEVFWELHKQGVNFNGKTLAFVIKICASVLDLGFGLEIHAFFIKSGLNQDVDAKYALMNFYDKCCDIDRANQVFYETQDHESLVWNRAVLLNLKNKKWAQGLQLFSDMQHLFVKTDNFTISKVLQACAKSGALDKGKQIHGYVIRNALESNIMICNSLISMYMKNNSPVLARVVFDHLMGNRNLSSWNSIISGYSALGYISEAWKLFQDMQTYNIRPDIVTWSCLLSGHFHSKLYLEVLRILREMQNAGCKPNSVSLISVLQAISELGLLKYGKEIHCYVLRNGFDHDLHLVTSLLDMYVKNKNLAKARTVFDNMQSRNSFAWNTMVSGHASMGYFKEALNVLDQMEKEGIKPNLVTYNILISGYSFWGRIKEASAMINQMKNSTSLTPDVVSWTALISGCSRSGYYNDALKYCIEMQKEGIRPNSATLASLIRCCAGLSFLQKGKELHSHCIRNGLAEDVFITTALIDMYSKSGCFKNAYEVFGKATNKRLASWNCMIRGFAIYNYADEAISLFHKMSEEDIQPDSITFTALLSGCRNSGLIDQGWKYFDMMKRDYNVIPRIEHYSCMVDLLSGAGYVDEAWDIIQTMPLEPDVAVWGAFLGACQIHGNLELGETAARKLFELEPQNPANYVSLMNLYAVVNKWDEVERIKQLMKVKGVVKSGHLWSWIQINQTVHLFSDRGKPHQDEGEIHFELYQLISEMKKKMEYVPATECVYQNIDSVEKEKVLLSHTEKLAITYGLIKTKAPAPIRVIKNTRICSDCHTVAKNISLLRNRDIFIKDGLRFHHFSNGKCSCNDFW